MSSKSQNMPNRFIVELSTALTLAGESLRWTSESDKPVGTIWRQQRELKDYTRDEIDGRPTRPKDYISAQLRSFTPEPILLDDLGPDSLQAAKWLLLYHLFGTYPEQAVFRRPLDDSNTLFELLLLVRFRAGWVGLHTQVVET